MMTLSQRIHELEDTMVRDLSTDTLRHFLRMYNALPMTAPLRRDTRAAIVRELVKRQEDKS